MIRLIFEKGFLSIKSFDITSLPSLTVITGLNGSGKTHLLKAIEQGSIKIYNKEKVNNDSEKTPLRAIYFDFKNPFNDTTDSSLKELDSNARQRINKMISQLNKNEDIEISKYSVPYDSFYLEKMVQDAVNDLNITPELFTENDFNHWYTNYRKITPFSMPNHLSKIFHQYYITKTINELNEYKSTKDDTVSFLTEDQFKVKYGEDPITMFNKYLSIIKSDYEIYRPNDLIEPYVAMLINKETKEKVNFNELSTGETTIFKLLFTVFSNNKKMLEPVDVLLLDEIDSGLHPELMQELFKIINELFIKELKINVIITTHSPTMVALANEQSLYIMNRTEPRLKKINKQEALNKLTVGIPTLNIDYNYKRQVFVESQEDESVYKEIYNILIDKKLIDNSIELTFIGSGVKESVHKGDCNTVKKIVRELVASGNNKVYGIIDWDNKNKSCINNNIVVLAEGERYSIENCILDPLLIGVLLIKNNYSKEYSLPYNNVDDIQITKVGLQGIVDCVCKILIPNSKSKSNITYYNGISLEIPEELNTMKGHDYEEHIKNKFDKLNINNLKIRVVNDVIYSFPTILPKSIYDCFDNIIKGLK